MTKLRLIVTRSTGFDHIDLQWAKARGVTVCNVPEYGSTTVAEFTFGLVLALSRKIPAAVASSQAGGFDVDGLMGFDLEGKTLGIIGLGKIGRSVARMAEGFGMRLVAYDPFKLGFQTLEMVLATSDVLAICCPLTAETHHLINRQTLSLMKPNAYLVNTARGAVVDSEALLSALDEGRLAGAALDVLEGEEFLRDKREDETRAVNLTLMKHAKVLVTPHLAYNSIEALGRIRETTKEILAAFAVGTTIHAVQP